MKKLIYLSLIAVIVLTGCKGNSFVSQRYTKFGHGASKRSTDEKVVFNKQTTVNNLEVEIIKISTIEGVVVCSNTSAKEENSLKTQRKSNGLYTKGVVQNSVVEIYPVTKALDKNEIKTTGTEKSLQRNKKTFQEKIHKAKGVISTTLKIILSIITLAIVICVIILVVLMV